MIEHAVGDFCPDCKRPVVAKDWTCPRCGSILDRYLFSTVTPKSLSEQDREAFWAGHKACLSKWEKTRSTELGEYRPVSGHETAYRVGWQHAADKVRGKQERKRGRRRGLTVFGLGVALTGAGVVALLSFRVIVLSLLGPGVVSMVCGLVMLLSGVSDE